MELLRPGYMLNGRLLRAARVSVASGPEEVAPPPAPADAATPPAAEGDAPSDENVSDDPTPYLKPVPLPLDDTGEVVFDPIPDPDGDKGGEPATEPKPVYLGAPGDKPDFVVTRGVTEPIARALAGDYLFAFEAVAVLLLAALVGAAFLAPKEGRA